MNASRQRTALLAFAMVFATVFANALVSYLNIRRMHRVDDIVRHTHQVIEALESLLVNILDAETGQRGYLITGDEQYLEPYHIAVNRMGGLVQKISELTADNPKQLAALAELESRVNRRLELLKEALDARNSAGFEAAGMLLASGKGRQAMLEVRDAIAGMEHEEQRLLADRKQESIAAFWTAVATGFIAALLGLCLAIAAYVLVLRDIQRQARAAEELQSINDKLEEHVRERTATLNEVVNNLQQEVETRRAAEEAAQQFAEDLKRSNRELEQFAAIASHDLQEPLRKIQAFGDRLQAQEAEQLGDKGRDYLERIQSSAARMRRLIDDLLAYSRVTIKAQQFSPVNLNVILEEVLSDLEGRLQQTRGRVTADKLPTIAADAVQMRQLFQNLIANSLKFHKPGEPPVVKISSLLIMPSPTIDGEPEHDLQLQVTIRDNGIGFEPDYKERIFELFQRLHGRDGYDGTGIGLAICKKIVQRHGGTIAADGAPGEGAVVTVKLPLSQRG